MCFVPRKSVNRAKVAKTDIVALKCMINVTPTTANSPIQRKIWTVGRVVKANLRPELKYKGQKITIGLHCLKTKSAAMRFMKFTHGCTLLPVLIPAGAIYYENNTQIVSSEMILLGTDLKVFRKVVKLTS